MKQLSIGDRVKCKITGFKGNVLVIVDKWACVKWDNVCQPCIENFDMIIRLKLKPKLKREPRRFWIRDDVGLSYAYTSINQASLMNNEDTKFTELVEVLK